MQVWTDKSPGNVNCKSIRIVTSDEPSKIKLLFCLYLWTEKIVKHSCCQIWFVHLKGKWLKFPPERLASFKLPQLVASLCQGPGEARSSISDCSNVLAAAWADYALINSSNDWVAARPGARPAGSGQGLAYPELFSFSYWPIRGQPGTRQPITGKISPLEFAID